MLDLATATGCQLRGVTLSGNYSLSERIERTVEAVPDRMAVIAEKGVSTS
jgi:hypothetical protein